MRRVGRACVCVWGGGVHRPAHATLTPLQWVSRFCCPSSGAVHPLTFLTPSEPTSAPTGVASQAAKKWMRAAGCNFTPSYACCAC